MGYTTNFEGTFKVTPALEPKHIEYLEAFSMSRRMGRNSITAASLPDPVREAVGLPVGQEGEYYVGSASVDHGQTHDASITRYNDPPKTQPGLWCQWAPTVDGTCIEWNGAEKFYYYNEWLQYIITNFLEKWNYKLNGTVTWVGEDNTDQGIIEVKDNVMEVTVTSKRYRG